MPSVEKADHPYKEYEDSPLWKQISKAISELEANDDMVITTGREYVIGYLCQALSGESDHGTGRN